MKTTPLLVTALLVATFAAVLPTADAIAPCTSLKDSWCPALFCKHYDRHTGRRDTCIGEVIYCVTEPCGPYALP